jgi:hypothetical protein
LNLEPENIYPLGFIDPAYNDADSEYHSSLQRNNLIRNGFTDKQLLVSRRGTEDEPNELNESIQDMIGSDGANIALAEVDNDIENLDNYVKAISLGNDVKAERYAYVDKIIQSKILQCFENIPEALVLGSDGSLIGDGGLKMKELKINYSEDLQYIRTAISQNFKK